MGGLPNCLFKWFPWQMAGVQVTMHGGGIKIALPKSSQTGPIYGTFWKAVANTNYKETVLLRVGIKIECQPYCEFLGAEKSTRRYNLHLPKQKVLSNVALLIKLCAIGKNSIWSGICGEMAFFISLKPSNFFELTFQCELIWHVGTSHGFIFHNP